jgi:hypothetical protein
MGGISDICRSIYIEKCRRALNLARDYIAYTGTLYIPAYNSPVFSSGITRFNCISQARQFTDAEKPRRRSSNQLSSRHREA